MKKLEVKKESIRPLTDEQMKQAVGGLTELCGATLFCSITLLCTVTRTCQTQLCQFTKLCY